MLIGSLCIGTAGTSPPKCHRCCKSEGHCRADTESWGEDHTLDSRRRPLSGSRSHTPSAYTSPSLTVERKYDCHVNLRKGSSSALQWWIFFFFNFFLCLCYHPVNCLDSFTESVHITYTTLKRYQTNPLWKNVKIFQTCIYYIVLVPLVQRANLLSKT